MSASAGLTVGHIPYLNCVPFFHYLQKEGFQGQLVSGVPAELNRMLQTGQLDISPSSSFEYARNWRDYLLLPGHSISAIGKVHSVLLFSPVTLAELEGRQIVITGESATSINLLRIILREFQGLTNVADVISDRSVEEEVSAGRPALLIGDRALRLAEELPAGMRTYDLGGIWHQETGLPFVFALWMIRRDVITQFSLHLSQLAEQLTQSCRQVLNDSAELAESIASSAGLSAQQIDNYWHSIDYRLENKHIEGLQLFFQLCVKHKLLHENPSLDFFTVNPTEAAISG